MNQSPSFLLPVDESSQRQSTPQYGNGANTSTPTTSFRYLEAMVVRSGAEAGRVKTGNRYFTASSIYCPRDSSSLFLVYSRYFQAPKHRC